MMKSLEEIKSEIKQEVTTYFKHAARVNAEPGIFGKITGKLRASKEILETAGQIAVDVANQYHEELTEEQTDDLKKFMKELLPSAYKEWLTTQRAES
ncbi:hypothetical protein JMN32_06800 [Fulvivirga sp. 29W222]|uniref:Uncharacterized protein n=1 Tax=Fulvivirga marina TaxID=2494733 RepID=A0A937FX54_9BACT|nr:hypothetical protein [Fulvivirga marina]MBL6446010.1 hypothetical protein [Fulvivirga marina]